jgi:uncharacterized SAM-binding protein YcdF (DUF218 family)
VSRTPGPPGARPASWTEAAGPAPPTMARMVVRLTGGIALLVTALIVATPLPAVLSRWLSVSMPLVAAEAIVVLGGGGVRSDGELTDTSLRRTHRGLDLYHRGLAPLLVLAGGRSSRAGPTEAEARAWLARSCAVQEAAILTTAVARTTHEEAIEIARLLRPLGITKILLVVDAEGMGRAQRLFRGVGFEVVAAPVNDVATVGGPETQLALARKVAMELSAWTYYVVAGRF